MLALAHEDALPADEAALRALLHRAFAARDLADVMYRTEYWEMAWHQVRHVWSELCNGATQPDALRQRHFVERPGGAVAVTVDHTEHTTTGPRWVWMRSGRERDDDHRKLRMTLYALAAQQAHTAPVAITLHYTTTGTQRSANIHPDKLEQKTGKLDELLTGIAGGRWEPTPGEQCKGCPFQLICPV